MRLSDERLNALELACAVGACSAEVTGGDLAALIAEVRALRPVEKAAEECSAFVHVIEYGSVGVPGPGDKSYFHMIDAIGRLAERMAESRAALAGVRALEDKP